MRRWIAALLATVLLLGCMPGAALAKKNTQMNDGVPMWTEETVRDYAQAYVTGKMMNTLYGYYDLQIRRYLPISVFESMLSEIEWMTGAFQGLGSYRSFTTPESKTKTHVLHLCMEKMDLDMYFTHKDKEDDWEVMALEFVPSGEEPVPDGSDMLVGGQDAQGQNAYDEVQVSIGSAAKAVSGTLTIPAEASERNRVPGCVLVHDWGALDRDESIMNTTFFADLAHALAQMGIASIRYDKRSYVHGVTTDMSYEDEVVEDAIEAGKLFLKDDYIDTKRIVVIGHGFGAMLAPDIASQSDGLFTAIVMIAGSPRTPLEQIAVTSVPEMEILTADERQSLVELAKTFPELKKQKTRDMTILGRNGEYFYDITKLDQVKAIKKMKRPTYILQGDSDPSVSEDEGWRAYAEKIGDGATYMTFKSFQGLDHQLAKKGESKLDEQAGKNISQWILGLLLEEE